MEDAIGTQRTKSLPLPGEAWEDSTEKLMCELCLEERLVDSREIREGAVFQAEGTACTMRGLPVFKELQTVWC